jgi:3-phenylpropionate/cinnamic acid dioxygenase small subunit
MNQPRTTSQADLILQHDIEQLLYEEAAILDERRLREWLAWVTEDIVYWMPARSTRSAGDIVNEFTPFDGASFINENYALLELRVEKLSSGHAQSEDPPSRTRHCVSNVRIIGRSDDGDELTVSSNIVVMRYRFDTDYDQWVGRRVDCLRNVDGQWRLARREIYLDQTVITSTHISTIL